MSREREQVTELVDSNFYSWIGSLLVGLADQTGDNDITQLNEYIPAQFSEE